MITTTKEQRRQLRRLEDNVGAQPTCKMTCNTGAHAAFGFERGRVYPAHGFVTGDVKVWNEQGEAYRFDGRHWTMAPVTS
jgi:hypothetical protein